VRGERKMRESGKGKTEKFCKENGILTLRLINMNVYIIFNFWRLVEGLGECGELFVVFERVNEDFFDGVEDKWEKGGALKEELNETT
jgi:hypothetical protein